MPDNLEVTRLSEAIRGVLVDRQVTEAEVRAQLGPIVNEEGVPHPEELQPLLDALRDPRVTFDAAGASLVGRLLTTAGYVLTPPTATISATRTRAPAQMRPLSAPDLVFERLATATGSLRTTIPLAVLDAPIDFRMPQLAGHAWVNPNEIPGNGLDEDDGGLYPDDINGFNFIRNNGDIGNISEWHGNASTALGVQGTDRIRAIGVTVMDAPNYEPFFRGLAYAIRKGARVITMSTTMERPENAERFAAIVRQNPRVLFVLAAGNEGLYLDAATARAKGADVQADNLIVVGAATADGGVWRELDGRGSNTSGEYVNVSAYGHEISVPSSLERARLGEREMLASGTSLATPQVANLASKCVLLAPRLWPADIHAIIRETSDLRPQWTGRNRAGGIVNEERAMTVTAVIAMVSDGVPLEQALDRSGVSRAERTRGSRLGAQPHACLARIGHTVRRCSREGVIDSG